jgi:hypothetical protein
MAGGEVIASGHLLAVRRFVMALLRVQWIAVAVPIVMVVRERIQAKRGVMSRKR